MKKHLFFMSLLLLGVLPAYAQWAVELHATGAYAFPAITTKSEGNVGYGGGVNPMYFINDQFSIGLNATYLNSLGNSLVPETSIIGIAPSFMFLIGMDSSPYFGFDVGAYFMKTGNVTTNAYGGAIHLGYLYGIGDRTALNINLRPTAAYQPDTKTTMLVVPLNVGVLFILGGEGGSTWGKKHKALWF